MDGITLQEMSDETVQQLHANYVRQPAYAHTEGTSAAYRVTLDPTPANLVDGFGITIVPHVTNEDNPTLNINGFGAIALKDQKGNPYVAGKLQIGKPYTFRKVGTDFLADSSGGSGDAIAGDIRAGKKATTDNGEIVGTLPVRAGNTVRPTTTDQTMQTGVYDSPIVVEGSPNLIPSVIAAGAAIFGVVGTYKGETYENIAKNFMIPSNSMGFFVTKRPKIFWYTHSYMQNVSPYSAIETLTAYLSDRYLRDGGTSDFYTGLTNGVQRVYINSNVYNNVGFDIQNTLSSNQYLEIHTIF